HNAANDRLRERICADLDELHFHATEESLAVGLQLGRHRELVAQLARLTAEHPLRERLVELHMLALSHAGRTADALDVYSRLRKRLADQLGLDPSPALQQLLTAILRGEPRPISNPAPPVDIPAPPAQLPADLAGFAGCTH